MRRLSQRLQVRPQIPGRVNTRDYFQLAGGLNLVDPPVRVPPGMLLDALNYEPYILGGYRSIGGYERFDGRRSPGRARLVNLIITDVDNSDLPKIENVAWSTGALSGPVLSTDDTEEDTILVDSGGELPEIGAALFDLGDHIRANAGNRLLLVGTKKMVDIAEDDKSEVGTPWTELQLANASFGGTAVHPDGTIMAQSQGAIAKRIRIYDTQTGQRRDDWPSIVNSQPSSHSARRSGLWSPDGKRLIAVKSFQPPAGALVLGYTILDVETRTLSSADNGLPFHDNGKIRDMAWSHDSTRVAMILQAGGGPVFWIVFDVRTGELLYTSEAGEYTRIEWVGADTVMVLGSNQLIEVRDLALDSDVTGDWPTFGDHWTPRDIRYSNGKVAVVMNIPPSASTQDPQLLVIDAASRQIEPGWPEYSSTGLALSIAGVDWSSGGKKLAVLTVSLATPVTSYDVIDTATRQVEGGWPNPFVGNELPSDIVWLDAPIRVLGSTITEEVQEAEVAFRETLRAQIQKVPGSGPVRGVQDIGDHVIAFRDDEHGERQRVWRATTNGWVEVRVDPYVRFKNGELEIADGDKIKVWETGEEFVARKVVPTSGFWSNSSQRGYIVYRRADGSESVFPLPGETGVTPEIEDGHTLVRPSDDAFIAFADGPATEHVIKGGSGYRQNHIYNFEGKDANQSMYSIDGRNFCIRYDRAYDAIGEIVMPIITGMPEDTPTVLAGHHGMLFLGYPNGSLQNSGINQPFSYNIVAGAAEQLVGDEIVALLPEFNDALLIYSRDRIDILYGRTPDVFQRGQISYEVGAKPRTVQRLGRGVHMDLRGFTTLQATDAFGDFASASISERIKPLIQRLQGLDAVSQISRTLSVYRCWFEDGTGLSLGFTGNDPSGGFVPIRYNVPVRCVNDAKNPSKPERLFFGSDDGFVYEQDVGTSFDGEPIHSHLFMVFNHSGSPSLVKHYRKVTLDMATTSRVTLNAGVSVNFGNEPTNARLHDVGTESVSSRWNIESWNEFQWSLDAGIITPSFYPEISGYNMSIYLSSASNIDRPHIVSGAQLHWSPRRIKREF